jgi:signal transduction histidine kinase/CHASE3 domain sensor protein
MRDRAIIGTYILALLCFGGIAVAAYVHFDELGEQSKWVRHTQEVLTSLEEGLGALRDIETSQRGYLIAGDERFLEPYRAAAPVVDERFERLRRLTEDNPAQQERIRQLRPVVERKLEHTQRNIETFRRGAAEEAREAVAAGRGKKLMDEIRRRVDELEAEERKLLEIRSQEAEATALRTTLLFVFGNGFGFALLASGTLLMGREFNRRRRLEQELGFRTERERLEGMAGRANERLRGVINELPLPVVVAEGPQGDIVLHNEPMQRLHGGPLSNGGHVEGHEGLDLRPTEGTAFSQRHPLLRALREGTETRSEPWLLPCADGEDRRVLVTAAPLRDAEGRVLAAVGILQDCEELERLDEQRHRTDRFREVFVSALGHDLRNPLSVLTAGSAALAPRVQTSAEAKIVARMGSSAARIARMIDQLLALAEARLGVGPRVAAERMDLGTTVREVAEQLEVTYPERTLEVTTEGELAGMWDREQVKTAIHNVMLNALEHGRGDAPVHVTTRGRRDDVMVEVHNWGNPIPEELRPLIFDPFRRAAERKRMQSIGLGIGLYLARLATNAHGGTIDLTSSAEAGTSFRITLPRNHA